ncbi:hypothetical protein ACNKHX_23825 [Shigella flexneri]
MFSIFHNRIGVDPKLRRCMPVRSLAGGGCPQHRPSNLDDGDENDSE